MLLNICNFLQPGQKADGVPSFSQSAFISYSFGPSDGNSWRTNTDVGVPGNVPFSTVLRNMDADATQPAAAGPGHWNDPDYLGPDQGWGPNQFQTQFSMWAMLAAPLMISDDMLTMSRASLATVSNRQVIAIDQDPAGVQATLVPNSSIGNGQVWIKPLADGSYAVALLNRGLRSDADLHDRHPAGAARGAQLQRDEPLDQPALDDQRRAHGAGPGLRDGAGPRVTALSLLSSARPRRSACARDRPGTR